MFVSIRFLFASICYHYDTLYDILDLTNKSRGLPLFALSARSDVQEWDYIKLPWDKTEQTPFFTGIPPHVILMSGLEQVKYKME